MKLSNLHITEASGESIAAFSEYVASLGWEDENDVDLLQQAGANLIKHGYKYVAEDRGQFGINAKLTDGVFSFNMPSKNHVANNGGEALGNDNVGVWDATDKQRGSFYRTRWGVLADADMTKIRNDHLKHVELENSVKQAFL